MRKCEDWAIAYERLDAFFREQPDVSPEDGGYRFGSCRIQLTRLEDRELGALRFPRTRISFDGDPEDTEPIYRRFFMRFISAGG